MKYQRYLDILRCPRTHEDLVVSGDALSSPSGERYPIVNGIPVLVKNIEPLHVTPPEESLLSKNSSHFDGSPNLPDDAVIIHLGCGDIPSRDPRVISLDILPTSSVDVVAEAEALPFKTGSVDQVVSGAVFEHLYDPSAAIEEVRRVLKPGGTLHIDTAFMQTYHGFPSHYFNMTPQAIETLLVDDFELVQSGVPDSGSVTHTLIGILNRLQRILPEPQAKRFRAMSVQELLDALSANKSRSNPLFSGLSEFSHMAMAASYVVVGRKPADYDRGREQAAREVGVDAWNRMKRRYYAARLAVIFRHHEVDLYRKRCQLSGKQPKTVPVVEGLHAYLAEGKIADTMVPGEWTAASDRLDSIAAGLIGARNVWLRCWQGRS